MASKALDGFAPKKSDADRAEQQLLTELLAASFPAYEEYGQVPWADLDTGKRILASSPTDIMTCAVARRITFICRKKSIGGLAWAGYDSEPDFHHVGLIRDIFKRLSRKKLDYSPQQLELLLSVAFGTIGGMPRGSVLGHVERYVAVAGLDHELRRVLKSARKHMWDDKLKQRADKILHGKKASTEKTMRVFLRKPDPWAMQAEAGMAASTVSGAWKKLLRHCAELATARPSQTWRRQAAALVDAIGVTDFEDSLIAWLGDVPRFADSDRFGHKSAKSFEAGNGAILRGLIWSIQPTCLRAIAALHTAASACADKIPDCGPRSTVVVNACIGKLCELETDDAVRALFDLSYNTNYHTILRTIDRATAAVAERRHQTVETLEERVGARAASRSRAQAATHEDSADLLLAIYKKPDDDGLRAVYADQLAETGDVRGEYIVLQFIDKQSTEQKKREKALYKKHREDWLGPLSPVVRSGGLVYRRGFPCSGRLYGDRHAELHQLVGHPAWATFEALDMDGCQDEPASLDFLSHPVMRRSLTALTCLHIQSLADLATDTRPWPLSKVGTAYHPGMTELDESMEEQRAAIGLGVGLPLVTMFVAERVFGSPSNWDWLLESDFGHRLRALELGGTDSLDWIARASQLMDRMDRVVLRPDPFFGGSTYDFEHRQAGIRLAIKQRSGDQRGFDELEAVIGQLRGSSITELTVSMPKDPQRARKNLDRLAQLCDSIGLASYRLPRPE